MSGTLPHSIQNGYSGHFSEQAYRAVIGSLPLRARLLLGACPYSIIAGQHP